MALWALHSGTFEIDGQEGWNPWVWAERPADSEAVGGRGMGAGIQSDHPGGVAGGRMGVQRNWDPSWERRASFGVALRAWTRRTHSAAGTSRGLRSRWSSVMRHANTRCPWATEPNGERVGGGRVGQP